MNPPSLSLPSFHLPFPSTPSFPLSPALIFSPSHLFSPELSSSYLLSPLTPSPPIDPLPVLLFTFLLCPSRALWPFTHSHSPPPPFSLPSSTLAPPLLTRRTPPPAAGPAPPGSRGRRTLGGRSAPSVTWSRDALQHGGAVGPRRRFLTGRRGRTRPVVAGTPGPQRRSPACSHRPPAGLPAPAGPGPCRRARPRACSCLGPWRRS